jgi:serine/threonine protein kinase
VLIQLFYNLHHQGALVDGREVAIKKLHARSQQGEREFLNEVNIISAVQHRNLIRLYGCCAEGSERLLVYEYLKNQSLDKHIFGN